MLDKVQDFLKLNITIVLMYISLVCVVASTCIMCQKALFAAINLQRGDQGFGLPSKVAPARYRCSVDREEIQNIYVSML